LVIFLLLSYYAQNTTDNISYGWFVRSSIYQFFADVGDPLDQSGGVGLLCQFNSAEKEKGCSDGTALGTFDLTPFE